MSEIKENEPKIGEPEKNKENEKIKEKVEKVVEKAEKKIEAKTGQKENLIGDLADPKINEEFDFKKWASEFNSKIDKLLSKFPDKTEEPKVEGAPPPAEPPKKVAWYDVELI